MRAVTALLTLALAANAQAEGTRTLTLERSAAGVSRIDIDTGVGDVEVRTTELDTVSARVTLRAKKGSFGSYRRAKELVEAVELHWEAAGATLRLRLRPAARRESYEASWLVVIPATAGLRLDAGVGDVRVVGVRGGVSVDLGVGNVTLVDVAGELNVDVGVGDVEVVGDWAAFGAVRVACGVGEVTLRTPQGQQRGKGFVGQALALSGGGTARLHIDAGVGDVTLVLR